MFGRCDNMAGMLFIPNKLCSCKTATSFVSQKRILICNLLRAKIIAVGWKTQLVQEVMEVGQWSSKNRWAHLDS